MAVAVPSPTAFFDIAEYTIGDAFELSLTYTEDGEASPKDFTGYTVTLAIVDKAGGSVASLVGSGTTEMIFTGTPAQMPKRAGVYLFNIRYVNTGNANDTLTIAKGNFIVNK